MCPLLWLEGVREQFARTRLAQYRDHGTGALDLRQVVRNSLVAYKGLWRTGLYSRNVRPFIVEVGHWLGLRIWGSLDLSCMQSETTHNRVQSFSFRLLGLAGKIVNSGCVRVSWRM